jgi:hypothetical protein
MDGTSFDTGSPPGRHSATMGWDHIFDIFSMKGRANTSVGPAGGNGTIMRTTLDG